MVQDRNFGVHSMGNLFAVSGLGDNPLIVNAMPMVPEKGATFSNLFSLDDFPHFPDNWIPHG